MKKRKRISPKTASIIMMFFIFGGVVIIVNDFLWSFEDYMSVFVSFSDCMKKTLEYGNGRYIGNFIVDFALNREMLDKAIRVFCIFSSICCFVKLSGKLSRKTVLIATYLIATISIATFRRVFRWGHGFYNYFPPVTLMLFFLVFLKDIYLDGKKANAFHYIFFAVFGFCGELFVETSSTVNLLIALVAVVYAFSTGKKKSPALTLFVATAIGFGVMFLGPHILGVADKMDTYRGLRLSVITNFSAYMKEPIEEVNLYVLLLVCALLKSKGRLFEKKAVNVLFFIVTLSAGVFGLYYRLLRPEIIKPGAAFGIEFAIALLSVFAVIKAYSLWKSKGFFVAAFVIAASFVRNFIVFPIGSRTFFVTYMLMSAGAVFLFSRLEVKGTKIATLLLTAFSAFMFCVCFSARIANADVNEIRLEYVREQLDAGKTKIQVIDLPYPLYVYRGNNSRLYADSWNRGDPDEMEFENITLREYRKLKHIEEKTK